MIEICSHSEIHSSQSLLHNMRSFSILYLSYSPISKVAVGNGLGQVAGRYRWYSLLCQHKEMKQSINFKLYQLD